MVPMLKHILMYFEALRTSVSFLWPCFIKISIYIDSAKFFLAKSDVLSSPALAYLEFCDNVGSEQRSCRVYVGRERSRGCEPPHWDTFIPVPNFEFIISLKSMFSFWEAWVLILIQTKCRAAPGTTSHVFLFCPETKKGWERATLPTSKH